jgi:predicted permease
MLNLLAVALTIVSGALPILYYRGWRFKKVTWNWTSCCIGVHAGQNPVSGKRFAYIGLGYGLGLDFHRPEA